MKTKHLFAALVGIGLVLTGFLVFPEEAHAQLLFRSRENINGTWGTISNWQYYASATQGWQNATRVPMAGDTVYIMSRITIPTGDTRSCAMLYNGVNHIPNSGWSNYRYHPSHHHKLTVEGTLTVTGDTYIVSDRLYINGGTMYNHGVMYVGYGSYAYPSTGTLLQQIRTSEPCLRMDNGTLYCYYTTATSGNLMHSGGLIFLSGSKEEINSGTLHIEGWLVGADDLQASPVRTFDLSTATAIIYMDGAGYPATQTALMYCTDENGNWRNLKLSSLQVDRPGNRRIEVRSWLEIHTDFELLDGIFAGAGGGVQMEFHGATPARCICTGGQIVNILPHFDNKAARITLYTTIMFPGFAVNNILNNFELFIDDLGAIVGGGLIPGVMILDGRVWVNTGTFEVRGYFQVGQPGSTTTYPIFDLMNAGRLFVSGILGGNTAGNLYWYSDAAGLLNAGTLEVEGMFFVDNAGFQAGGSNTIVLSGNVGRLCQLYNNSVPSGKINATLIIQNLTIRKTGTSPGDQVDIISDIDINGDLCLISGILNGVQGWTVYLYGQWPMNPPLGSGQGFTGGTALEIRTTGRFVLPGGQGPLIRINKNDPQNAQDDDLVELGGNMSVFGLQLWDGRFNFMGFNLHVTGNFTIGSGNPPLDQLNVPTVEMEAADGGGTLDIDATSIQDGNFLIYNHCVSTID
ncbi:MAG: hypothetical protein ACYTHM_16305, partial [Planctomycetota bacterium]